MPRARCVQYERFVQGLTRYTWVTYNSEIQFSQEHCSVYSKPVLVPWTDQWSGVIYRCTVRLLIVRVSLIRGERGWIHGARAGFRPAKKTVKGRSGSCIRALTCCRAMTSVIARCVPGSIFKYWQSAAIENPLGESDSPPHTLRCDTTHASQPTHPYHRLSLRQN
eukprot:4012745-Pyramimonas_sp.AAC.1